MTNNTGPAKPPTRAAKKTAKKAAKKTTKKVAAKKAPAKKPAEQKASTGKAIPGPGSDKRDPSKAAKPAASKSAAAKPKDVARDPLKVNSTDPLKMPEKRARESLQRVYQLQGEVDRMGDRAESAKAKHDAAKQQLKDAEKALHEELHQQKAGAGPLFE